MKNGREHHAQRKMTKVREIASTTNAYKSWALRNKETKKKKKPKKTHNQQRRWDSISV